MDIAITGASGFIGSALRASFESSGHTVSGVGRSVDANIRWDPATGAIDAAALEGLDAVVHLAGAGIASGRWSDKVKRQILDSRVEGTRLLATTLAGLQRPPATLLSGSAIGYYGERGDESLTEASGPGSDFLAGVVGAWEQETAPAEAAGIRVAHLRTGIVLSPDGGALAKMLMLFKVGLGGRLGSGRQYWSTISLDDQLGMIEWLLQEDVHGPVNMTCPEPTTNAEFTKTLGQVLGRPTLLPVPTFGPKLLLGSELATSLLFTSARVLPAVAQTHGYTFQHATLEAALRGVLGK